MGRLVVTLHVRLSILPTWVTQGWCWPRARTHAALRHRTLTGWLAALQTGEGARTRRRTSAALGGALLSADLALLLGAICLTCESYTLTCVLLHV